MAPRWGGLRLEPYDPDARDADNDGIVQEGTAWERPAGTRLLTDLGDLARGRTSTSRPAGLRVVDREGNEVPYTPTYGAGPSLIQKPGASTPLADHGAGTLAERGLRNVRTLAKPEPAPPPQKYTPRDPTRDIVYYHATSDRNVASILRDGLIASDPSGGDPYLEDDRGEAVYMGDIDTALEYGDAVFAISMPPQDIEYDPEFSHDYFPGNIPPERLRLVTNIGAERRHAEAVNAAWEAGDEYPDPPTDQGPEGRTVSARVSRRLGSLDLEYGEEIWMADQFDDPEQAADAAYSEWSGYEGNYRMRHASAAFMGLPVPPADGEGIGAKEVNEILATGSWEGQPAWAREQAQESVVLTTYLMDGVANGSPTERPMYRGLADVPPSAEILNYQPGDEFTMPLSAFSPNRRLADSFAQNPDGAQGRSVMVVLEPGARAFAAPEGYEDYFQDADGEWVEDQAEYITHGDFEVVSTQSRRGITVVTIRQKGTYTASGSRISTKAADQEKSSRRIPRWTWALAGPMRKPPLFRPKKPNPTRVSSESQRTAGSEGGTRSTKTLRVKARRTRKFEPYDPDAQDGDNDGIVQDGTPWERPAATRIVDAAGQQLRRGLNTQSRPAGSRIVDADGNTVEYTPKDDPEVERPTIGGDTPRPSIANVEPAEPPTPGLLDRPAQGSTPLADHGAANLKERGLRTVRDMAKPPEPQEPKKPAARVENQVENQVEPLLTQVPEVATEPLGSFSDLDELEDSPLGPLAEITDAEDVLQMLAGGWGQDSSYDVFFALTDRAMAGLAGVEPGEPLLRLEIDGQEYQVGANWADADPYDEREGRVRAFAATRLGDHLLAEGVEIPEFDSKYRIAVNTKTGRLRQVLAEDAEEFDDLVVVPADHPEHRRLEHILYARDVLDQWASSSAKGESLQLMGAAEKLFGVPAPLDTAKPPEERHLAIARFVYAETQRTFADMGVTHVPLHRGMGIYLTDQGSQWVERTRDQVVEEINTQIQQNTNIANELREFLRKEIDLDDLESLNDWAVMESLGSRAGDIISAAVTRALQEVEFDDDSEVELRPISSWSLSRAEANNFGGTTHPSRITVSALVPVERIFSMPATGPSMHDEMEMLVVGGNARVQAEATIGRQDAIRAWWAALVPDLQNGYFD